MIRVELVDCTCIFQKLTVSEMRYLQNVAAYGLYSLISQNCNLSNLLVHADIIVTVMRQNLYTDASF